MKDITWFLSLKALTAKRPAVGEFQRMTTSLIAKRMSCHPATARRHLSRLEKENLVRSEKQQLSGCIQETVWEWRVSPPKVKKEKLTQQPLVKD